jgi:type 1 glutamine amidotransferase
LVEGVYHVRTLVLCDDYWHPAQTVRDGLGPLEAQGFMFDWIEQGTDWSAERMQEYPTVIITKTNHISASDQQPWVNDEAQSAFMEYVRQGNSVLAIHSGSAGYDAMPVMRSLLGGVFVHHPPQCAVTIEPRAKHHLTTGVTSFTLVDEHYFMDLDDKQADVFLTSRSTNGIQPAGWTRTEGDGRVCLLTPGHNLHVWLHPSYQTLLANALRWCHRVQTAPKLSQIAQHR